MGANGCNPVKATLKKTKFEKQRPAKHGDGSGAKIG